ncbi:MAG: carbohydrate binding family 9 domain-containing protein [Acidobacteria bacterium]|nr:carbohydrate binding family 9 domain-containing protein [Acidobacteriota bacterium]
MRMDRRVWLPIAVLAAVAWVPVTARSAARMVASAAAVPVVEGEPMVIDGRMDEGTWERAGRITDFIQREPAEGQPPSHATEARVAFDGAALYVAIRAFDSEPDRIVGILTRRDQHSPSDWVKVIVDSYLDRRSAYEFAVNPVGVKRDRYYFNDGPSDDSWDAVWDVQVARDREGWRAEFRIPFSQLRFNGTEGGPVGLAIVREVGRLNEISTWPLLSRNANGFVSQFGELQGIRLGGSPRRLELMPYTVGKLDTHAVDAGNTLARSPDPGGALGLDLKYAVTPGLTLTATVNPDFGQVEADPAVVNLDAFEAFFPERRPFFVEGSGTFRFNMDCNDGNCTGLFYSRRIGRAPQGSPDAGDGEFSTSPDTATILGAAKLTGRIGRFSVGGLQAVTVREDAVIAGPGGIDRRLQRVEPLTSYSVARVRREYANQSALGFMLTSTNRQVTNDVSFLSDNAYAGGVDYDWRLSRAYSISGFWAGSHLRGSPEAIARLQQNAVHSYQRPDSDYTDVDPLATTLSGHAGSVSFGKIAGDRTRFNTSAGYKSPGFDSNDLGFQRRADERTVSNWFQYRDFVPGRFVRNWNINVNQWAGWNFGGDRLFSGGNINTHWTFVNQYNVGMGVNLNSAPFRDRITRGGPGVLGNASRGVWFYANTDHRKALSFSYNGYYEADGQGTARRHMNPSINLRPSSALALSAGLRYERNEDDAQWVSNVDDADGARHYVFGRIDQKTVAMTLRFNYTMTPNLSLQTYAEPFVSAGDYSTFRELVDGRAARYPDRYRPYDYTGPADFNIRSFRTTNVLRWEYKPGSQLFLVWQQGRFDDVSDHGTFQFNRDVGGLFRSPSRNVFLVKFTYWVNM